MIRYSLARIAEILDAEHKGDPDCEITSLASITHAKPGELTFLESAKLVKHLETSQASIVVLNRKHLEKCPTNAIIVDNPHVAFAKIASLFEIVTQIAPGIHKTAVIGKNCQIHASVYIGANAVVGDDVTLDENVALYPNCTVSDRCQLGANTVLKPQVTLYHDVKVGKRCTIHSSTVIGSDGFGYANDKGQWIKVAQIGSVEIGDDVEIGSNTSIDRGAIDNTVIGNGVKLDNQIQIAHNVEIGDHTAIAGCCAIAGSTKIGRYCMIAGFAQIIGHITIADQTIITAGTAVAKSITEPGQVWSSGSPAVPHKKWLRNTIAAANLAEIAQKFKKYDKMIQRELSNKESSL